MSTKRVWFIAVVGLVLVIGILAGTKFGQFRALAAAGRGFSAPPESVTTARVEASEWQPSRSAVGSLVAVHGVMLGSELSGTIRELGFDSGARVKKGDVLVRLDTSVEEAQLASAVADVSLARLALARAQRLKANDAVTQAELETAEARAAQAEANAQGLRATIAKKTIRAPFPGRVAIRQVELGQVVSPGTPLVSLQSVDPIYVDFWLPQKALAEVEPGQVVHLKSEGAPLKEGAEDARDGSEPREGGAAVSSAAGEAPPSERTPSWEGTVSVVNTELDPATRNVKVRATVPNPDGRLLPGMYVSLEVVSPEAQPVLLVPATAVLYAPYGDTVYGVEEKAGGAVARQKFVRLGERRGDFVAVVSGLEAGERVVTSGAFKLRNGAALTVKNELAPKAELEPHPMEE